VGGLPWSFANEVAKACSAEEGDARLDADPVGTVGELLTGDGLERAEGAVPDELTTAEPDP